MIVGNGLIGSIFKKKENIYLDYLIFASGVSNSKESDPKEFIREKELLIRSINENKHLTIIYFSSILVGITKNNYYDHKLDMEELIKKETNNYVIFRIPQLIGDDGNRNNLVNYLISSINLNSEMRIQPSVDRALIDIEDLEKIVDYCRDVTEVEDRIIYLSHIETINIIELIEIISSIVKTSPNYIIDETLEINNWYFYNSPIVSEAIKFHEINPIGYTEKIIKKYI